MTARHIHITGLVHGVFFRSHAKEKADKLGLTGCVKNCNDGSVEIFAEGPEEKLKALEEWCWKGPPRADVQSIRVEEGKSEGEFASFEIWQ